MLFWLSLLQAVCVFVAASSGENLDNWCSIPTGLSVRLFEHTDRPVAPTGSLYPDGYELKLKCAHGTTMIGPNVITCVGGDWDDDFPLCDPRPEWVIMREECDVSNIPYLIQENDDPLPRTMKRGQSIHVKCAQGELVGERRLKCGRGGLMGPMCQPVAATQRTTRPACRMCSTPNADSSVSIVGSDMYSYNCGESITYSCNDQSAKMQGSARITCQDGRWNTQSPKCVGDAPARPTGPCPNCKFPSGLNPMLRLADGSPLWQANAEFVCGCSVSFSCSGSAQLQGCDSVGCSNGQWNDTFPSCQGAGCTGCTVNNGPQVQQLVQDNGQNVPQYLDCGAAITLKCRNPNADMTGDPNVHCTMGPNLDSSDFPTCCQKCKPDGIDSSVKIAAADYGFTSFDCGETITFECANSSWTMVGMKTSTCQGPAWENKFPICKYCRKCQRCSLNSPDPNLQVASNSNMAHDQFETFDCNETVIFKCKTLYVLQGSNSATCMGPSWDRSLPNCLCNQCTLDVSQASPFLRMSDGSSLFTAKSAYECSESITFSCQGTGDYRLSGQPTMTCQAGKWDNSLPNCTTGPCKGCSRPSFVDPNLMMSPALPISSHFDCNEAVCLECKSPYILTPPENSVIQCMSEESWSTQWPTCVRPCSCTWPGFIDSMLAITDKFGANPRTDQPFPCGQLTFACKQSFQGQTYNLTGMNSVTCSNSQWSNNFPTCQTCVSCQVPLGTIDTYLRDKSGNLLQQMYSCGPLYVTCANPRILNPSSGNPQRTCRNGTWDSSDWPTCILPTCSCQVPQNIDRNLLQWQPDWTSVNLGSSYPCGLLCFTCKAPMEIRGCATLSCARVPGNIDQAQWNSTTFPTCYQPCKGCIAPSTIDSNLQDTNGQRVSSATRFAECKKYSFRCGGGFQLTAGQDSATCNIDGTWSNAFPACACPGCVAPQNIDKNLKQQNGQLAMATQKYACGTFTFSCPPMPYSLTGNAQVTCGSTGWSSLFPTCYSCQSCQTPGNVDSMLMATAPTGGADKPAGAQRSYQCGTVHFYCNSTRPISGAEYLSCADGQWSSSFPTCQGTPCTCNMNRLKQLGLAQVDTHGRALQVVEDFTEPGREIRFKCNKGVLVGASTLKCNGPDWNSAFPSCRE